MAVTKVSFTRRPGRAVLQRAAVAVALTAATLALPTTAHAEAPGSTVRFARHIPSAPCLPGGVTSADEKIADRLRPAMTGRRLGRAVAGRHISCARAIVGHVRSLGLGERAAVIAVTTAIAESTLNNYTVAVDHDSLGLFQQRPSTGWGRPAQLVDPRYATSAFLKAMIRKHPAGDWTSGDIGRISQRVQGSAYPGAYAPEASDAHLLVMTLWPRTGAEAPKKPQIKAAPPAAKKPTGPFHRVLSQGPSAFASSGAQDEVVTADWDGDRRADLVKVGRAGTVTGRTELQIMSGAGHFQHRLLHTGTLLGPTDARHAFSLADWNSDGRLDLVVVLKSGTTSGRTELRILDGASAFRRFLVETVTVLDPTDERHVFSLADWNGDQRLDLIVVQKSGTASGKTEVQVFDGASSFQAQLAQTYTALDTTDDRHEVAIADWNADQRLDLIVVQKSGTTTGKTEVQVVDGASHFQRFALRTSTAEGPLDDRHEVAVADWNGDGQLELLTVQKSGTASGRTEVRILGKLTGVGLPPV
ncbi:FG-GAP repeat domain-containing protein [Actinoplanes solisilvae]|uniref:FG-GAP repeat domain-containing protein n=1 Tax=Actinoplanes solisilvae TaxID=2486853 RepID=UPI000FD70934|nr:VCBS repeat-containing protein [Actinoplanes solisilvae]